MAELSRQLARNSMLQMGGKGVGTLLGILTISILLRSLGTFGYGEFTTAITFVTLFATVVDFGLTLTTVQMISEPEADEHRILSNLLSLRLVTGVIFFSVAPLVGLLFPYSTTIKIAIAIGSIAYLFSTITQMLMGIFQKRLQMWRVVVAELVNRSTFLVGALVVAALGGGVARFVIALTVAAVLQCVTLITLTKPLVQLRFHLHTDLWREIFTRSWPIGMSIFFNLIYMRGDIVFLSLLRSTQEVGTYGAAYKMVDVITAVPAMFMGLVLPILVAAWQKKDRTQFTHTIQKTFDVFAIAAIPVAVGAFALGGPIMIFIGGEQFEGAGPIMRFLAPACAFVFFGALFAHAAIAVKEQKKAACGFAIVAALSVVGYLVAIPRAGVFGAAAVTLLSEGLITCITFGIVARASRFVPSLTIAAKTILASVLMLLTLPLFSHAHILLQIFFGAVIYTVALTALGGLHPHELKRLLV